MDLLNGLRVLDVSTYGAVPLAGVVLSDWGADVIKVEDPNHPDVMRTANSWGIAAPEGGAAHLYHLFNRGKRNAAINLKHQRGHEAFMRLVDSADVILTNFMTGVRQRLKIDVEHIHARQPRIIYGRNTGRGLLGPDADQGGFDTTSYWARAGVAMATTHDGQPYPTSMPSQAFGDGQTGFALASGVVAGLFNRERTGKGMVVDTSLLANGMWAMQCAITGGALVGREVRRVERGTGAPLNNPFRTRDGRFIHVGMDSPRYWESFCDAVGRPEWKTDPQMATHQARDANPAATVAALDQLFAERDYAEWLKILPTQTGPYDPVQYAREVGADPQAVANGYVCEVKDEVGRSLTMVSPPVQFNQSQYHTKPGAAHGEHTDELLLEAGYSYDEVIQLKIEGAIL